MLIIALSSFVVSILFNALATPSNIDPTNLTIADIISGILAANPFTISSTNVIKRSIIFGPYFTKESSTPTNNFRNPSAKAGTHSTITSIVPKISSFKVANNDGIILGIISKNPTIIASRDLIAVFAPFSPKTDNAERLATINAIANDTAIQDKPNKAIEPLSDNIVGIRGLNTVAAIPIAANIPTKASNPFARSPLLTNFNDNNAVTILVITATNPVPIAANPAPRTIKDNPRVTIDPLIANNEPLKGPNNFAATPRIINTPANDVRLATTPIIPIPLTILIAVAITVNAEAATNNAIDPPNVPLNLFKPTAKITIDTPKATNPLTRLGHEILLIFSRPSANGIKADVTIGKDADNSIISFLGYK